jgi:hypothetical protein
VNIIANAAVILESSEYTATWISVTLLSWAMGVEKMDLLFDGPQLLLMFVTVYLLQNTIYLGKSNLEVCLMQSSVKDTNTLP